jgi:hypothetical protein
MYFIQQCFICHPSDFTVSEDAQISNVCLWALHFRSGTQKNKKNEVFMNLSRIRGLVLATISKKTIFSSAKDKCRTNKLFNNVGLPVFQVRLKIPLSKVSRIQAIINGDRMKRTPRKYRPLEGLDTFFKRVLLEYGSSNK